MLKNDRTVWKSLMMISQIGISMLTPIFLCVFIGLKLDQWLSTNYWFIIMVILGVLSSFRSVYLLTRRFYSKELNRELDEQKYFEGLKKNRKDKKEDK